MKQVINNWDKLPVVMDTKDAARTFDVSVATIKNWIYSGKLKANKIGRKWSFDREYLRSLIEIGE